MHSTQVHVRQRLVRRQCALRSSMQTCKPYSGRHDQSNNSCERRCKTCRCVGVVVAVGVVIAYIHTLCTYMLCHIRCPCATHMCANTYTTHTYTSPASSLHAHSDRMPCRGHNVRHSVHSRRSMLPEQQQHGSCMPSRHRRAACCVHYKANGWGSRCAWCLFLYTHMVTHTNIHMYK